MMRPSCSVMEQKVQPPKQPRKPLGPNAKKALTIAAIVLFFAATYGYFTFVGQ